MIRLSKSLEFPPELAGRRTAVFGISGSGKSNTATVIVEQLIGAGEQVVVVDPKGEAHGLLSLADGKPSNLPVVVFGEPNGHISPIAESHGPRLADFVVDSGRSVALSLLGFESDQSERRFVASFLRQLYRRKSRQAPASRTLVVLEEAHLFVPENARGDATELAGAVQRIVRQGRSCGLGTLLVDQRPQDVSKRVITQCETLICHQLTHKLDRDALADWVRGYDTSGQGKTFLDSLASLQPGEAWVWSPGWLGLFDREKVNRRKTFDTGAAPDGKAGPKSLKRADVDLDSLRGQLEEVVATAKANDPSELKKRIAELEKKLAAKTVEAPAKIERVEVPVLTEDQQAFIREAMDDFNAGVETVLSALKVISDVRQAVRPVAHPAAKSNGWLEKMKVTAQKYVDRQAANTDLGSEGGLSPSERAVLDAIASFPSGATRRRVSIYSGRSYDSSSFQNAFPSLMKSGYIEKEGERYRVTDGGAAFANARPGVTLEDWCNKLMPSESKVLRCIAQAFPNRLTRADVSAQTGQSETSSSFQNAFPALRDLELIEGKADFRLNPDLAGDAHS